MGIGCSGIGLTVRQPDGTAENHFDSLCIALGGERRRTVCSDSVPALALKVSGGTGGMRLS